MASTSGPLSSSWMWKRYVEERDNVESLVPAIDNDQAPSVDSWSRCPCPSEIYVDLIKSGFIPDPLVGFNEHKVQWVADDDWIYGCTFDLECLEELQNGRRLAEIVFEGLDTFCTVYLNSKKVLITDNMFRSYSLPLNPSALPLSRQNTLVLVFKSAKKVAKQLESEHGAVRAGSCNLGDPSRVYVRKAQYHFRWDWGPELVSAGPWRPIVMKTYTSRISHMTSVASVRLDTLATELHVTARIESTMPTDGSIVVLLKDSQGTIIRQETLALSTSAEQVVDTKWGFAPGDIALWWPVGYGKAALYRLEITFLNKDGQLLDQSWRQIGFRDIRLCQEPLLKSPGTSFYFRVNGVKMFMGGSNWIPADSFLTRVDKKSYRAWLELFIRGNQNCIRVWGGGIYEEDVFYDLCDELGILVWQDFAFACGVYPAHEDFVKSVQEEATDNIIRLRHHPSLAILCGNNEDYQQVLQWDLKVGLPAAVIYEDVLPKLVEQLTAPSIPYVRGSPYGGQGWDTSDPTVGDVHQWNVWAGSGDPYQDYDILGGRFVSEFGVPSLPCLATIERFFGPDDSGAHRHPQCKAIQQHTKAGSYERRLGILMNENFRMTSDLETYVYLTQLMQSEAIGGAYRVWRRKWQGDGHEETSGVLVWQLNDCWPASSWALVDYYMRPKSAFYSVARELKPITVGIQREVKKNRPNDRPRAFYEFGSFQSVGATIDVWATNSTLESQQVKFQLYAIDLESNWTYTESRTVELLANASTEIISSLPCPHPHQQDENPRLPHPSYSVVYAAFLHSQKGEALSQHIDWPQPLKFLEPRDPHIKLSLKDEQLTINVQYPVKGLVLSVPGGEDNVTWSDNCVDIIPTFPYTLKVEGLTGRQIHAAYLGKEKAQLIQISG